MRCGKYKQDSNETSRRKNYKIWERKSLEGINGRLIITEVNVSELEVIKTLQGKKKRKQGEKKTKKTKQYKTKNPQTKNTKDIKPCGITSRFQVA